MVGNFMYFYVDENNSVLFYEDNAQGDWYKQNEGFRHITSGTIFVECSNYQFFARFMRGHVSQRGVESMVHSIRDGSYTVRYTDGRVIDWKYTKPSFRKTWDVPTLNLEHVDPQDVA